MDRLSRLIGRTLVPSLVCAGALACPGPAFAAGDKIPRPPGAIENRGYELVSQADKNGTQVFIVSPPSRDGTRVLYDTIGGVPGSISGARPQMLATRTAKGWKSKDILPPPSQWPGENYFAGVISRDVTGAAMSSFDGLGTTNATPDVTIFRLAFDNTQTLLHPFPMYFGASGVEMVASDDLSHVFANVPEAIDPSHQPGTFNVYDFGTGTPVLVSRMPSTGDAPTCGLSGSFPTDFANPSSSVSEHWVSTNGLRAFFATAGDDAPDCDNPRELYMRDQETGTTTLISGPPVGADTDFGVDAFLQATPDGSQVFYRTATSLVVADDTDGFSDDQDVYRWSDDDGNVCITCGAPHAEVGPSVVSEDGSRVYFLSAGQFAGAPAPGSNLYVWQDGDIDYASVASFVVGLPIMGGDLTPNGKVLIFQSNQPELNAVSGSDNGGTIQVYRYDDGDGSVTCVSCPAGAPATTDVESSLAISRMAVQSDIHAVTDDGSRVFFRGSDALVPEDVNQNLDIYEWHNGTVRLITSGREHYRRFTGPEIVTVSPDGRDFLFKDTVRLTTEAQDDAVKLYDARIGGGFEPAPAPRPACLDDQCQGDSVAEPPLAEPGSATARGPGNVKPRSRATLSVRKLSSAQRARLARTGKVTIRVKVNRAARISAFAQAKVGTRIRRIASVTKVARKAGTIRLTLKLSRAARAQLSTAGRLHVVLAVRSSKVPRTTRMTLSLKATADGR